MSLSTLLEAAKYLDYLDSSQNTNNNNPQPQQHQAQQHQHHHQQQQPDEPAQGQQIIIRKAPAKSTRRPRNSKRNEIIAMSLPNSASFEQRAVPISSSFALSRTSPAAAGLSCSYTPGSPQSSPTSIALLSSKTSGVTSNISSAASSLSSSDSSSSCGEILMSELDFNHCATSVSSSCSIPNTAGSQQHQLQYNKHQAEHNQQHQQLSHMNAANIELLTNIQQPNNNNQLTHPFNDANRTYYRGAPTGSMPQPITGGNDKRAASRRKTSKSAGPKMMTLTTNQAIASSSVPLDGSLHAGRVFQATNVLDPNTGQLKFAAQPNHQLHNRNSGSALDIQGSSSFMGISNNCFNAVYSGGLNNQTSSPQTGSLIMARVQPMILNSLAPSAHQSIMAFQQATAPSPTSTSSSYSRHRELHKTLEKNRRAHLRHCFELLKAELPGSECVDRKTSHINIIKSAIRCVLSLIEQGAKLESELQRQLDTKSRLTNQLAQFKDTLSSHQQPVAEQQLSFLLSRSKID